MRNKGSEFNKVKIDNRNGVKGAGSRRYVAKKWTTINLGREFYRWLILIAFLWRYVAEMTYSRALSSFTPFPCLFYFPAIITHLELNFILFLHSTGSINKLHQRGGKWQQGPNGGEDHISQGSQLLLVLTTSVSSSSKTFHLLHIFLLLCSFPGNFLWVACLRIMEKSPMLHQLIIIMPKLTFLTLTSQSSSYHEQSDGIDNCRSQD